MMAPVKEGTDVTPPGSEGALRVSLSRLQAHCVPEPGDRAEELWLLSSWQDPCLVTVTQPQCHPPNIPTLDPRISGVPGNPVCIFVR